MAIAGLAGGNTGKVSPWWLISAYAIVSLGELMLSPMGLSLVSKVAPAHMRGLMMGGWFVATAIGNKLTAIGVYWRVWDHSDLLLHPGYDGTFHVGCFVAALETTQESHARRLALLVLSKQACSKPRESAARPFLSAETPPPRVTSIPRCAELRHRSIQTL